MKKTQSKTIAILQLTRPGDIIQSLHVFRSLKEQHPEIRLVLIARERFTKGIQFLIDQCFDRTVSLKPLDWIKQDDSLEMALKKQDEQLERINTTESISALINLSFSKSSALLSRFIEAKHKLGLVADRSGGEVALDKWSQYISASVMSGPLNGLSLVDLYRMITGAPASVPRPVAHEKSEENSEDSIVIHPFASHAKKHWRPQKWSEIIYKVLKDHPKLKIHIVGGQGDQENSEKIVDTPSLRNYKTQIYIHAGAASIQDTWNLISSCDLFVGHDSMVSHMASLANKNCLTVSLGTVRPHETAPYGENNYVLSPKTKCFPCFPTDACESYQCHADISYHVVASSISTLLKSGRIQTQDIEQNISPFHLGSFDFYRTEFSPVGMQKLVNINPHSAPQTKLIVQQFLRMAWLYLLEQKEEQLDFYEVTPKVAQDLKKVLSGIEHLFDLCEFGKKYSHQILEEVASETVNIKSLKEFSSRLDEVDELSVSLKNAHPHLTPVINYLALQKATLGGDNLVKLSEASYITYDKGSLLAKILFDLIDKNLKNTEQKNKRPETDV